MPKPATGSVKQQGDRFIAHLRHEYLGSFETEPEAWRTIQAALNLDADVVPDTLRLFGSSVMKAREESKDVRGIESELSVFNQHILEAPFVDQPIKKIGEPVITAYLLALVKKPKRIITSRGAGKEAKVSAGKTTLGRQTIKHVRRLLICIFDRAVAAGKMTWNPAKFSKLPKMAVVQEDSDEWAFLSAEQIDRLFRGIDATVSGAEFLKAKRAAQLEERRLYYRAVFSLAIYGGIRQGEVFGLHFEDLHADMSRIEIRRLRGNEPLKNEHARRAVPLLPFVVEALDAWRRRGGVVRSHGIMFPSDSGSYYSDDYDALWVQKWRRVSGAPEHLTFHDLRHTCASHLIMGTWGHAFSLYEVKDWLGHSDIEVTQRYAHLAPDSLVNRVREMAAKPFDPRSTIQRRRPVKDAASNGEGRVASLDRMRND